MQNRISILIFTILLNACSSNVERNAKWAEIDLVGKRMTLIDAERIEVLSFGEDGFVMGTFGTKGGGVFGPVLFWRIEKDALIISDEKNSPARASYLLKTIKGDVLKVSTMTGSMEEFELDNSK